METLVHQKMKSSMPFNQLMLGTLSLRNWALKVSIPMSETLVGNFLAVRSRESQSHELL